MILPIVVIAIGAFITGDFSNHQINSNLVAANVECTATSATFFNQFVLVMVWLYILGWSTYGPEAAATFAPEYKDTTNDTRKALASTGGLNVVLSHLLPIVVLGTIGYDGILADDLRRPLPGRRAPLDRRGRASGRSSSSASAAACSSR